MYPSDVRLEKVRAGMVPHGEDDVRAVREGGRD